MSCWAITKIGHAKQKMLLDGRRDLLKLKENQHTKDYKIIFS